jgi:hypothetical protein
MARPRTPTALPESAAEGECEGYHKAPAAHEFSCARPGCYVCFTRNSRSPLQSFCSALCRRALRRVLQRESRWLRRAIAPRAPSRKSISWPDP